MRFDIRNYFKTGKTPYTAQFSEDFSTENFDGSVIREPVTKTNFCNKLLQFFILT